MEWNITHGLSNTPLYHVWYAMMKRCYRPQAQFFHLYGGRGITVCAEWHNIHAFFAWARASGYEEGLFLDKKDNDKGYSSENCRWLSHQDSNRNRSCVKLEAAAVAEMKAFHARGVKATELMREYSVSKSNFYAIMAGEVWTDIPPADYLCIPS